MINVWKENKDKLAKLPNLLRKGASALIFYPALVFIAIGLVGVIYAEDLGPGEH